MSKGPFKIVSNETSSERAYTALFLSETTAGLNEGAAFLSKLTPANMAIVRDNGRAIFAKADEQIFLQGDPHAGIYLIETGRVRVYYTGPSGREITLAYWPAGHFIGGPEIYGAGTHVWSGEAVEDSRLIFLPGAVIRTLIARLPSFALCLVDGLVAKGKCYSALVQMLGTRSVIERLAQFLLNIGELHGEADGQRVVIDRTITHDQIASMVGATRQWVTMTLDRFQKNGIISVTRQAITIEKPDLLHVIVGDGPGAND
jgi:CRP/FNR family transcriptional regulator, cyclic AMP receptor protein